MDDADRAALAIEREEYQVVSAGCRAAAAALEPQWATVGPGGVRLCMGCGEPLDPRRLAARPSAVRCIDCQRDAERGRG